VVPIILSGACEVGGAHHDASLAILDRASRGDTCQEWSERPFQAASNMMGRIGRFAFQI